MFCRHSECSQTYAYGCILEIKLHDPAVGENESSTLKGAEITAIHYVCLLHGMAYDSYVNMGGGPDGGQRIIMKYIRH